METERIILRERTPARMQKVLTMKKELQYIFFGLKNERLLEKEINRIKNGQYNNYYSGIYFDFILKETKEVIGSGGFHTWWRDHDRAEIGYGLYNDEHKRKGYMNEVANFLIAYGFEKMKLNRVEAKTAQENIGSIILLEKLGFKKEGTIHGHYKLEDGSYSDDYMFYLLKDESPTLS